MPIYLYENVALVPGETGEYMRAFRDRYLPLNDKYDTDFIQLSGFFSPDVLYTTSPRVVILWSIPEWAGWGNRNTQDRQRNSSSSPQSSFSPS